MNKKIIYIVIVLVLIIVVFLFFKFRNTKIYLDNSFYNEGNFIEVSDDDLNNIKSKNYVLFTYNNFCSFSVPCEEVFEEFMKKYKIDFLKIKFEKFKNTKYYKSVKYGPSVLVIKNNKIVSYLDAEKDEDIKKYENSDEFEKWIKNYIYLEPMK